MSDRRAVDSSTTESSFPNEDMEPSSSDSEDSYYRNKCGNCKTTCQFDWTHLDCQKCKRPKIELEYTHDELHHAIDYNDCKTIRVLLENGVKPCTSSNTDKPASCFILVCMSDFLLKKLLEVEPAGVNCQSSGGYTMLMLCVRKSTFDIVCEYKPDLNLLNENGDTILFHVLQTKHYFLAYQLKKLLELGVDVNSVNKKGETALVVAIKESCKAPIIEILFEAGANVPPPEKDGESIIIPVIQGDRLNVKEKIDLLKVLVKYGVYVGAKDQEGHNAMYHIIMAYFEPFMKSREQVRGSVCWIQPHLEEVLIMLLEQNCELQGLDITERDQGGKKLLNHSVYQDINYGLYYELELNIISVFALFGTSVKFLKHLVDRGLYDWKKSTKLYRETHTWTNEPTSPIAACLSRFCTNCLHEVNFRDMLETCKYLISIGVDATHRCLNRNYRLTCSGIVYDLLYERFRDVLEELQKLEKLVYPDALLFAAQLRTTEIAWSKQKPEKLVDYEELLRLLLRFWPYPPLYLMLLRVESENRSYVGPIPVTRDWTLLLRLLIKIGGAIPLGSRYYMAIKFLLQSLGGMNPEWQEQVDLFLHLDGGIPTLLSLSRAAFRATVKKTCPTGLDFSEYRFSWDGKIIPLPEEIISYLEFRPLTKKI